MEIVIDSFPIYSDIKRSADLKCADFFSILLMHRTAITTSSDFVSFTILYV